MEPRERAEDGTHPGPSGWERLCRALGVVGVACFVASAYTPLPNLLSRGLASPTRVEPAEAIVVLASGVSEDGLLGGQSLRRAVHGIVLQRKGLAPLLVLSGPAPDKGPAEALVRDELARELGISPDAILTETEARTTREEAIRIGAVLRQRQVRRILLVTSSQHMMRARRLFERGGFEVFPASADDVSDTDRTPEGRLKLTRQALQEVLARIYYRVAGYL